jgi:excisionase family DNA binding protein
MDHLRGEPRRFVTGKEGDNLHGPATLTVIICLSMDTDALFEPAAGNGDRLLTTTQVAKLLGVHAVTVRRWINEGKLPAYRVGEKAVRIRRDDLAHLLTPMRDDPKQGSHTDGSDQAAVRRLSDEEQRQARQAIANARRLRAAILTRREGKRFPDSVELTRQAREDRTRELMRASHE